MSDLRDRVKDIMGVVFNTPAAEISDDAGLMTTAGWDSLGHAHLMLALEEEFSITLPSEVVIELQTLPEIVGYLGQLAGTSVR